jgi:membrane protein
MTSNAADATPTIRGTGSVLRRFWRVIAATAHSFVTDRETSPRCAAAAFFGFLSFFPAIATVVLIYGIFADGAVVLKTIDSVRYLVPSAALSIATEQLGRLTAQPSSTLGLGLLISVPLTLWSSSRGVDALLFAMSRVRHEKERRGFLLSLLYAVGFSLGGGVFLVVALATVAGLPALIPWPSGEKFLVLALRWPILLALSVSVLSVLYRFGPDRHPRRLRFIWPGAALASILWLVAGAIFSIYVENWGHYEATFGSVSAAVVLLLWLYNSAQVLVLGAAFNAELERSSPSPQAALFSRHARPNSPTAKNTIITPASVTKNNAPNTGQNSSEMPNRT